MNAALLLRQLLEKAPGDGQGYLLVLEGEGFEELPEGLERQGTQVSVHRVGSELGLRHLVWRTGGAPFVAVLPETLARRLPADLLRASRGEQVHALAPNDVLSILLSTRVTGADDPHLRELALQNLDALQARLSARTLPTVVDRKLLGELLVELGVGGQIRRESAGLLLAQWLRTPPAPGKALMVLLAEALPRLYGSAGSLLAWAAERNLLEELLVHGALMGVKLDELPEGAWGSRLWALVEEDPAGRSQLRRTLATLADEATAALGEAATPWLERAGTLARKVLPLSVVQTSLLLPLAFQDRCAALARSAARGEPVSDDEIAWLRGHRAARGAEADLAVLESMARLTRWLGTPPSRARKVGSLVSRYLEHGAFADRATAHLQAALAGTVRHHAEARALLERVRVRRDAENQTFAGVLAADYNAALHDQGVVPLHKLGPRVLDKARGRQALYLVVLDGCSLPIFLDLLEELAARQSYPIGMPADREGRVRGLPGIAPLPTVTSHARGALFLGAIPQDPLLAESRWREQEEGRTDPTRFNQNATLGDRTRKLFLKGKLRDGGAALVEAIEDHANDIVAVVFNAVDDQIGSSNTGARVRIKASDITGFVPSLKAALRAGRRVLLTADHGHSPFVSHQHRVGAGGTPRYLELGPGEAAPEGFIAIDLGGLGGSVERGAFAWRMGAYRGHPQVGFHGGCSLEEMVVPMAWLVHQGLAAEEPGWWRGRTRITPPEASHVEGPPAAPPPRPAAAPKPQLGMFKQEDRLASLVAKARLPESLKEGLGTEQQAILGLLRENGQVTEGELGHALGRKPHRARGLAIKLANRLGDAHRWMKLEYLDSGEMRITWTGPED